MKDKHQKRISEMQEIIADHQRENRSIIEKGKLFKKEIERKMAS